MENREKIITYCELCDKPIVTDEEYYFIPDMGAVCKDRMEEMRRVAGKDDT